MNVTPFAVYLISRLDTINILLIILTLVSFVICVLSVIIILVMTENEGWESSVPTSIRRFIKWPILALLASSILLILVPTTRDAAAMFVIPRIANSQTVNELGEAIVGLAKEWCAELRPKIREGGKK